MSRTSLYSIAVIAVCLTAMNWQPITQEKKQDIDQLKKERIEILEKRVELSKTFFEHQRMSRSELAQIERDLVQVKLEYATTDAEKKKLYQTLIDHMDSMIDVAKLRAQAPPVTVNGRQQDAGLELLKLQSEKLKLQIEMESIGQ